MTEISILSVIFIIGLTVFVLFFGMIFALVVLLVTEVAEGRRSRTLTKGIKKEAEKEEDKKLR